MGAKSTLYNIVWDVVMDWKLQPWNCSKQVRGLRTRRMFASPSLYYAAVAVDAVLRFGWTATLVPHWFAFESAEKANSLANSPTSTVITTSPLVLPLVIVAELGRRAMWAIFRLESEHLHNTEGFRRVEVVPLHFDHTEEGKSEEEAEKQKKQTRRSEVIIELLVYAAVVSILAYGAVTDWEERPRDHAPQFPPPSPFPPPAPPA